MCITYTPVTPTAYWVGINWLHPQGNYGGINEGFNLEKATRLTFWARGEEGGEPVTFSMGGLGRDAKTCVPIPDAPYPDSVCPTIEISPTLDTTWQQYSIDLAGKDLSHVVRGFFVSIGGGITHTIYLDEIRYESDSQATIAATAVLTPTPIPMPTPTATPTPISTLAPSGTIGESGVYCTSNGGGGTETLAVDPPRPVAQFRIDMKRRATSYGDSLWEVEAYGPDTGNRNLVIGGKADASSAQDDENCTGCLADKAVDGDMTTRWCSDWYDPQWLEITLPDPQMVNRIALKWEAAHAGEYCVTVTEPATATPTTLVHISNVQAGDIVPQSLSLRGEYAPEVTDDIWILVGAPAENVWPQSPNACEGESTVKTSGLWEVRVGVGGSDDAGKLFEIIVTTAGDQASHFLTQMMQTWCQQDNYPGIPRSELPSDLTSWQSIIVRRGRPEEPQPRPDISNVELPGQVILEGINNGDTVPHSLTLGGTYTNDVTDDIWVLVYPPNGRYYPQSTNACEGVSTIQDGGLWEAKTNVGGDSDAGKPFDIIVVLVNEEAHACFKAREEEGCLTGNFPGFYYVELPPGIDEKASVSVIRE